MSITKPIKNNNAYKDMLRKKIATDNKNYKYYEKLVTGKVGTKIVDKSTRSDKI